MSADPRVEFLIALGRVLQGYGVPAHRLEDALGNAAAQLGIEAAFLSTPTSLISSFGPPGQQETSLCRIEPGALQLDKLVLLDEVVEALYRGEIEVTEARDRLRAIAGSPSRYGPAATMAAFAVASGAAALFFGGGWNEAAASLALGLLTGLLAVVTGGRPRAGRVFEFAAAMCVTFLAALAAARLPSLASAPVILASLVVLLPGLSLTLALNELATGHLVSGTARLSGSFMTFLKLGLGMGLGRQLAELVPGLPPETPAAPEALGPMILAGALVVTAPALGVLFRARVREMPWILLGTAVAFWGARVGVSVLGAGLGAAVGALLLGVTANTYARRSRHPAVVVVVPSLILLVPGAIGYQSFEFLLQRDVLSGVDNAFTALLVGVSLVAGLLVANLVVPPRNAL